MAYGVQILDSSGTIIWDSTTVSGGLVVDYRYYAAGAAGETINYTSWAGHTAFLLENTGGPGTITLDTSGSYPVVTVVSNPSFDQSFALAVL